MPTEAATEMKFELRYQGEAVELGRMSARELGPAIFSIAEMLERTGALLYQERANLRVDVSAQPRRGSFVVDFSAAALPGGLVEALTSDQLANISTILGVSVGTVASAAGTAVGWTVMKLIRWQRGRKLDRVEPTDGGVRISIGAESITVNHTVYNIFKDAGVRAAFEGITEPLRTPGIDAVEMRADDQVPERIDAEEARFFAKNLAPSEDLGVDRVRAWLEVVAPSFRDGNKWRFAQGEVTFYADILDEGFLERVRRHEVRFGQGDALRVEMEVRTSRNGRGLTYERTILKVLNESQAPQVAQTDLLDGEG